MPDEGIVFYRIPRPLDIHILQRMRRQFVIDDVFGRDAQKSCLGHAKEFVQMRGVAGSHFQSPVDVGDSVGIAVDKYVDGNLFEIRQPANKAAAGARGDASHADQDAVGFFPIVVLYQPLKHSGGFDHQNKVCISLELERLDGDWNAVGARAELGAVDAKHFSRVAVVVDHGQASGDVPALFFGNKTQLLAVHAEISFDIVHDRVGFRLFG